MCRSFVVKLAYVAQDRADIAESVKCFTRHIKEPRSGHMIELQEVGTILDEEQEVRVDVSTTDVRCVVASARGFRLDRRLALKKARRG